MIISVPEFGANSAKLARIVPTAQVTAHVAAQVTGEVTGEVAGEVAGEVLRLLRACAEDLPRQALQSRVGIKHDEHFRLAYMRPALDAALIEMTIPDKPRSRLQKYRLTAKGRALLAGADTGTEKKGHSYPPTLTRPLEIMSIMSSCQKISPSRSPRLRVSRFLRPYSFPCPLRAFDLRGEILRLHLGAITADGA